MKSRILLSAFLAIWVLAPAALGAQCVADFNGDGKPGAAIVGQVEGIGRGMLAVVNFFPSSPVTGGAAAQIHQ